MQVVDETDAQGPGHEFQVAPNVGAGGSHPQATLNQEWTEELLGRSVGWSSSWCTEKGCSDVKTDVAVRRLERLERRTPSWKTRSARLVSRRPLRTRALGCAET